jgi:hypothetical protein
MGKQLSWRPLIVIFGLFAVVGLVCAQILSPILVGTQQGIPTSGLVADYDLTGGADVQSIPNRVSGGPALQRGSTSGTDTNDPTPGATGWGFDGTDDEGRVYPGPSIGTNPSFTLIALFNASALPSAGNDRYLVAIGRNGSNSFAALGFSGKRLNGRVASNSPQTDTSDLSLSTWYCGVLTYQPTVALRLYKNGQKVFENTSPADTLALTPGDILTLGVFPSPTGDSTYTYRHTGLISRVFLYNRALTDAEITKVYTVLKSWGAGKGISLP